MQGRGDPVRCGRRRRQPRLREHAVPGAEALLRGSAVGRAGGLGGRARAALRHGGADARGRAGDLRRSGRRAAQAGRARTSASRTPTRRSTPACTSASPARPCADPYFGGEGPERRGCVKCGRCMIGCRYNAKNTLVKNYLYLAERRGRADRRRAQGGRRRAAGRERRLGWLPGHDGAHRARGSARTAARRRRAGWCSPPATMGTNALMQGCRARGSLPRISHRLGYLVRTNSEAILAVTVRGQAAPTSASGSRSPAASIPIPTPTSRRSPTATAAARWPAATRCSPVRARGCTRPLKLLARGGSQAAHAAQDAGAGGLVAAHADPAGDADAGQLDPPAPDRDPRRPRPPADRAGPREPEPDLHRRGQRRRRATRDARSTATPQSSIFEALANIPTTAHILGGAVIGRRRGARRDRPRTGASSATSGCSSPTARRSRPTRASTRA